MNCSFFQDATVLWTRRLMLAALWMVMLPLAMAQSPFGASPFNMNDEQEARVQARMVADIAAIEPGRPFRLGVLFTIEPEWHIYWQHGGDSGLATEIVWNLPPGFKVGALQWPAPERSVVSGLINYGYEREVLLFAEVTPPDDLPMGAPVQLAARTNWLVCKDICLPEDSPVALTLPTGSAGPSSDAGLFEHFAALVPAPAMPPGDLLRWDGPAEPVAVVPGQATPVQIVFQATAPWKIVVAATGELAPALFPLPDETWEGTNPVRTGLTAEAMTYTWDLTPRPQTTAATLGSLQAVVRVPLVNPETNESKTIVFSRPIEARIDAGAAAPVVVLPPAFDQAPVAPPSSGEQELLPFVQSQGPGHSLFYFLVLAFLGGVLLNVMPCVLPVISLKVMSFVRQAGEDPRRILRMGLAYGAGVLASFAGLAAVVIGLKLAGSQVGWGFQLQEPRFVIAMCAVVLAFGLSLLGVYSIELPGMAVSHLGGGARREGYGGSFFNGVLATALATPCVAPLLGPALGFAFTQSPQVILLVFLMVGLGLAAPYLLLAANPGLLRYMPRPGAWMEILKQFMGFALIGTLVWLLSVLGSQIGAEGMVWTLAFLVAVAVGCWLIGLTAQSRSGRRHLAWAMALLIVAGAYLGFPQRHLTALAQVPVERTAVAAVADTGAEQGIDWQPFSVPRVMELVEAEQTVFVDFTADWCLTCKVNEKGALASELVAEAFRRHNVTALKADWTRRDESIRRVLAQFDRSGVPFYVIFPAGRPAEFITLPTLLTPGMVIEHLEQAAQGTRVALNSE